MLSMRIAARAKTRYLSTLWYLHKRQYGQSSQTRGSSATTTFCCPTTTTVTVCTSPALAEYALFRSCTTSKRASHLDIQFLVATSLLSNQRPTNQTQSHHWYANPTHPHKAGPKEQEWALLSQDSASLLAVSCLSSSIS